MRIWKPDGRTITFLARRRFKRKSLDKMPRTRYNRYRKHRGRYFHSPMGSRRKMSYHDGYNPDNEGIAVVNPLLRIEKKFEQIRQLLEDDSQLKDLTTHGLKDLIEKIIQD